MANPFPLGTYVDSELQTLELDWLGPEDLYAYLDRSVSSPSEQDSTRYQKGCDHKLKHLGRTPSRFYSSSSDAVSYP
jgi:hypothetical protein